MKATERLYYNDSHLTEFEASVTSVTERVSGWGAVTLDRTAFYPTGGGQPSDTGTLGTSHVVECIDDPEAGILHVIHGKLPQVGSIVKGHVDWPRRLDHMQQHTGQHILSQAFFKLFNAETRSFRMMEQYSEIDLEMANPSDALINEAVELANKIIWEDRPVHIREVTPEEAAELPLRKDSERAGELRIIEIEDFDLSPCGGTHAARTGEVGIITVRSWERAKGLTRIEFLAGSRVASDYRRANRTARTVAALFSVARDEAAQSVERLLEENKQLTRRVRTLEELAARVEAEELFKAAIPQDDGTRVIARVFEGRDPESLKRLAHQLASQQKAVALLGSSDKGAARLVFARSEDAAGDMNQLMRSSCALLGGRGGGKPDMAQGGGQNDAKLEEAIEAAKESLSKASNT